MIASRLFLNHSSNEWFYSTIKRTGKCRSFDLPLLLSSVLALYTWYIRKYIVRHGFKEEIAMKKCRCGKLHIQFLYVV